MLIVDLPQWAHSNGFSPLWMRMCSFKWCLNLNALPHSGHLKRRWPHSASRRESLTEEAGAVNELRSETSVSKDRTEAEGDRTAKWMLATCSSNAWRPFGPRNSFPQSVQRETSSASDAKQKKKKKMKQVLVVTIIVTNCVEAFFFFFCSNYDSFFFEAKK